MKEKDDFWDAVLGARMTHCANGHLFTRANFIINHETGVCLRCLDHDE